MIRSIYDPAPNGEPDRALLVMLSGIGMDADEFVAHDFVSAVHDRRLPVDIVAVQPELDTYLEGQIAKALHVPSSRRRWRADIAACGFSAFPLPALAPSFSQPRGSLPSMALCW